MTEPALNTDKCASCGAEDDHPKFHLLGASESGLAWTTLHHDCAALLGHAKASLIVDEARGAKGAELRAILTDAAHPVHAALAEFSAKESADIHAANLRALGAEEGK